MATNSARYPVVEAFVKGKAKRDASAMRSDGTYLYSYGMKLARRYPDSHIDILVTYDQCPTVTTKYHHRAMMDILRHVNQEPARTQKILGTA